MGIAKIIKCRGLCKNEFQDRMYGVGMRVANPCGKGSLHGKEHRCTVCKEKQ